MSDIDERMAQHVGDGGPLGAVWCLDREGEATIGWAGSMDIDGRRSVERGTIFRISSMTKPITGVAALTLVADRLGAGSTTRVDRWLPELADRRGDARSRWLPGRHRPR